MLFTGSRIGAYELLSPLGAGGMGEVYRAKDLKLGREVAIKILPEMFASDPDRLARFQREAKLLASLNHPNIGAIYGLEEGHGQMALVLELVPGETLADRISRGPIPLDEALPIAKQIAEALDAAHEHGIIHRDLKPANIRITPDGVVKVLDFGLAKLAQSTLSTGVSPLSMSPTITSPVMMTGAGVLLGTAPYMSPEQAKGREADKRSDVWAFGCVLYEMLTGRRAFDGADTASVIAAILERAAPSAEGVAPPALDRVLQTCLAKNPRDRWQSALDIAHTLELVDGRAADPIPLRRRWSTLAVASFAGFIAASAVAVAVYTSLSRPEVELRRLTFPLPPPAGAELRSSSDSGGSAISPDGRSVAFVAETDGVPRLWVRLLDTLAARELPGTDGARLPFWSPDSRSLAFFTSADLRRIDLESGISEFLARAPDARGGAWNADGTIVFSPTSVGPLLRISDSAGKPVPLTTVSKTEIGHRWPQFLPDGRTILYVSQGRSGRFAIFTTTLDRPNEVRRVLDAQSQAVYFALPAAQQGYLLWAVRDTVVAQAFDPATSTLTGSPVSLPGTEGVSSFPGTGRTSVTVSTDGTLLYGVGGTRFHLAWFTPDGTPLGTVGTVDQYIGLRLSPDGSEALVQIRDPAARGDLWRIDLARGGRDPLTSDGGSCCGVWSPDSQRIAFSLSTGLDPQTMNSRGGGGSRLPLNIDVPVYPSDWSREGDSFVYTENSPDTSNDILRWPMTGAGKPTALVHSTAVERHGQLGRDGRWLAFTSNASESDEVYVQNWSDASTRRTVSRAGGSYPRWGPGGRDLWYRASDGRLMRVPIRFVGASIEFDTPVPTSLRLPDPPGIHPYPYDVAPDGRILALVPAAEGSAQLTVLMNWQTALEP